MEPDVPWNSEGPLPLRFVIYIPLAEEPSGRCALHREVLEEVQGILARRFGGVTSYPATGLFMRSSGRCEEEKVQVLESFCQREAWRENQQFLHVLAGAVGAILQQESIACQVDGRMHLIDPDRRFEDRSRIGSLEEMIEGFLQSWPQ